MCALLHAEWEISANSDLCKITDCRRRSPGGEAQSEAADGQEKWDCLHMSEEKYRLKENLCI